MVRADGSSVETGIANESYAIFSTRHTRSAENPTAILVGPDAGWVSIVDVPPPRLAEIRTVSSGVDAPVAAVAGVGALVAVFEEAHPASATDEINIS